MSLTEIEYGALASSEVMNNNFQYLDNKISDVSENLSSTTAIINTNIATANSSISNLGESMNKSLENMKTNLTTAMNDIASKNGLYITTYTSGTSWYREYFSDAATTKKVWLEQGGLVKVAMRTGTTTVKLLKEYSNTNFTVLLGNNAGVESNPFVSSKTVSTIVLSRSYTGSSATAGNSFWYTCGV